MPLSARIKKNSLLTIALSITTAGFFVSATAHASDGMMSPEHQTSAQQLASIDTDQAGHQHLRKNSQQSAAGHSNDTLTDQATDSNTQIGGYSREDGAMMGAYGDGEYGD
jgi:uncharacterized protein YycO